MPPGVLSPASRSQLAADRLAPAAPRGRVRMKHDGPALASRSRISPSIGRPNGARALTNLLIARSPQRRRAAVESHALIQHPHDAPTRYRAPHGHRQAFAIARIDHGQQPHPATVVERLAHEVERPGAVQHGRGRQGLAHPPRHPPGRPARQMQPQRTVHAMYSRVVSGPPCDPQPVEALPEAPSRGARNHVGQGGTLSLRRRGVIACGAGHP